MEPRDGQYDILDEEDLDWMSADQELSYVARQARNSKRLMETILNENIIGKKFGKLTVKKLFSENKKKGYYKYTCLCDCGNIKNVYKHHLVNGQSKTCGCSRNNRENWKPRKDIKKNGESGLNYFYSTYKRNAKKRSYSFKLTKSEFEYLTKQKCHYCGVEPRKKVKYHGKKNSPPYICNGVDRVDNSLGYIKDNCVPCCSTCNKAKGSLSEKEWEEWVSRFVKNNTKYFSSPSGPAAMFDIDDTLILWNTPDGMEEMEIEINCNGVDSYRVPNEHNIELLKKFYESGHVVILWSGSGVKWCKAVAKALGIEDYIHGCISKPQYYIDDIANPKEWIGKHGYFKIDGTRVNGDNLSKGDY